MHFKSFVLASFAVSITTAIPIPQACPFNWKRSAQSGCIPQTAPLPSLLPYLSDPESVPSPLSPQYFNPDISGATSPNAPTQNVPVPDTRPPPRPLTDYAPAAIPGLGAAGWGLWKLRQGAGAEGLGEGN